MDNPGVITLGDFTITGAGTQIGDVVDGLAGMLAAAFEGRFAYGSGGTACKAYIQTSLDQGATWIDIICMAFATSGAVAVYNLSALTPKTTALAPLDGTLPDNTSVDGVLGDRFRAKVISTGTYGTSTLLSLRGTAR